MPIHVVDVLLNRVRLDHLFSEDFAEDRLYLRFFQPVEDIISNHVRRGDVTTARRLIGRIERKMGDVLIRINMQITSGEVEDSVLLRTMVFSSLPFARLYKGVATASNKTDAVETTIDIIRSLASRTEGFWQSSFVPAFKVFESAIEEIYFQAKHRYSSDEYKADRTKLEIAFAEARAELSEFVG
jgi:hypothetical protein